MQRHHSIINYIDSNKLNQTVDSPVLRKLINVGRVIGHHCGCVCFHYSSSLKLEHGIQNLLLWFFLRGAAGEVVNARANTAVWHNPRVPREESKWLALARIDPHDKCSACKSARWVFIPYRVSRVILADSRHRLINRAQKSDNLFYKRLS